MYDVQGKGLDIYFLEEQNKVQYNHLKAAIPCTYLSHGIRILVQNYGQSKLTAGAIIDK